MIFKLLTEQHLEFLSLNGGCTGLSEPTLVKMPHCWKSHVAAHLVWTKARIFLLVDLREIFFRFRVGGTKKKKKSSENDQSIIKKNKKRFFFLNFFFQIFREQTVKQ